MIRLLRRSAKAALVASVPPSMLLTNGPRERWSTGRSTTAFHVALTFDDGPHPEHTPSILDSLAAWGIRATFFLVGQNAESHPAIVRRIALEGHELGNHTYSHHSAKRTATRALVEDIRRSRGVLEDITGRPVTLFRPPRGELTLSLLRALWSEGQTVALWNVDAMDGTTRSHDALVRWFGGYRPRTGDIILMHDDHPHSASAIPYFGQLASHGLGFASISQYAFGRGSFGLGRRD